MKIKVIGNIRLLTIMSLSAVFQLTAILFFILASRTSWASFGKTMSILAFIVISFIAFRQVLRDTNNWFRSTAVMAVSMSLLIVLGIQSLGFLYYPGLVKDLRLFETAHLTILVLQLLVFVTFYMAVGTSTWLLRRWQKKLRGSREGE